VSSSDSITDFTIGSYQILFQQTMSSNITIPETLLNIQDDSFTMLSTQGMMHTDMSHLLLQSQTIDKIKYSRPKDPSLSFQLPKFQ
jgi:hypothetical protein